MRFIRIYGGPLVFLVIAVNCVAHLGSRWEFGPSGIPRSVVSPGGHSYSDGTLIDPLTSGLIRAGIEEEVMLAIFLFIVACVAGTILILRDTAKKRHQVSLLKRMLADLRPPPQRKRN
jgi:hypothetical protein